MKRIAAWLTGLSLLLPAGSALAQAVSNTDLNVNQNRNQNQSGAQSTGGDARNLTYIEGESVESDSDNLVLYPIPGLNLQNIDQMIQTKLGTVNCAVEDQGGSEFRLGFPPAIVFKDQNLDGGDCMEALNKMSAFMQADILSNMVVYVNSLDVSPEYKRLLKEDLTAQILDLFIEEREALEQKARTSTIEKLKTDLDKSLDNRETYEERSRRILNEGKKEMDYAEPVGPAIVGPGTAQ